METRSSTCETAINIASEIEDLAQDLIMQLELLPEDEKFLSTRNLTESEDIIRLAGHIGLSLENDRPYPELWDDLDS